MGEFELLERIRGRLARDGRWLHLGSGDDAAITVPTGAAATSVDALVEDVHFRRRHASLDQIGRKAMGAALSDLAAMGAEAGEAYVALFVPPDLSEDECVELFGGLAAMADAADTALAGGDITRAQVLALTVTVVGYAAGPGSLVTRAGARPGDAVVVTGELGGAAAGLLSLEHPERAAAVPPQTLELLRRRQLEPQPRLGAGRVLAGAGARAMIDISDGLGGDARHLASASGVGVRIDAEALPLADGVRTIAAGERQALELAVGGGEDYELLATLPSERFPAALTAVNEGGDSLTRIGEVVEGTEVEIRLPGGEMLKPTGFDQLG